MVLARNGRWEGWGSWPTAARYRRGGRRRVREAVYRLLQRVAHVQGSQASVEWIAHVVGDALITSAVVAVIAVLRVGARLERLWDLLRDSVNPSSQFADVVIIQRAIVTVAAKPASPPAALEIFFIPVRQGPPSNKLTNSSEASYKGAKSYIFPWTSRKSL